MINRVSRRDASPSPIRSLGASLMASHKRIDLEPSFDPTVLQSSSPSVTDLSPNRLKKKDPYINDETIKLVPCRWSNSGWKYVKEEPQ